MTEKLSNTTLSNFIVEMLSKHGIYNVCICPGSRNTPLNLAFLNHKEFKSTSHIDERGAGFFSLGIAKASLNPAVILTTSGTAVANLLPSIIEADLSLTPLIIITADRPKSLLYTGENQTIKQDTIFKDFVRERLHIDSADNKPIEKIYENLDNMIKKSMGSIGGNPPGPIHLNISFDEPLVDENHAYDIEYKKEERNKSSYEHFLFPKFEYPAIVCGQLNTSKHNDLILELSEKLKCPIFADPLSQLRYDKKHPNIFCFYDYYIDKLIIKPDYIIRFGKKPVSKKLTSLVKSFGNHNMIQFSDYEQYNEDVYSITIKDIEHIENTNMLKNDFFNSINRLENKAENILSEYSNNTHFFEGNILLHCLNHFKHNDNLFIGNSLAVRNLEKFCPNIDKKISVYSNRGASGIDGLIATALGTSYHNKLERNILILGDISFFHDINSLLIANHYTINMTIIVINNYGGQIFNTLPYKQKLDEKYNKFWTTPLNIKIKESCTLYKLDYDVISSIDDIKKLDKILDKKGVNIVEIKTDFNTTKEIEKTINQRFQ